MDQLEFVVREVRYYDLACMLAHMADCRGLTSSVTPAEETASEPKGRVRIALARVRVEGDDMTVARARDDVDRLEIDGEKVCDHETVLDEAVVRLVRAGALDPDLYPYGHFPEIKWPTTGLEARARELLRAVEDARGEGGPAAVVVFGPPGVGKTALLAAALRLARRDGRTPCTVAHRGCGPENRDEFARKILAASWAARGAPSPLPPYLHPKGPSAWDALAGPDRSLVADGFVLFVDDERSDDAGFRPSPGGRWADDVLPRDAWADDVVLVVTDSSLDRALAGLPEEVRARARRFDLAPLGPSESAEILSQAPPASGIRDRTPLALATGGNPAALVALVRHALGGASLPADATDRGTRAFFDEALSCQRFDCRMLKWLRSPSESSEVVEAVRAVVEPAALTLCRPDGPSCFVGPHLAEALDPGGAARRALEHASWIVPDGKDGAFVVPPLVRWLLRRSDGRVGAHVRATIRGARDLDDFQSLPEHVVGVSLEFEAGAPLDETSLVSDSLRFVALSARGGGRPTVRSPVVLDLSGCPSLSAVALDPSFPRDGVVVPISRAGDPVSVIRIPATETTERGEI